MPSGDAGRFVGRVREIGLLRDLVSGGGARVVLGEAGVGRTALLRHLADEVPHRVLWVRGSRAESAVPFAAVQVLIELGEYFTTVPPARRRAVELALALVDGAEPGALAVCAGALGVLTAAAKREPLLVLVDDLQWVDPESRRLLDYVGRRLAGTGVTLVMALRDEPGRTAELPDLPLLWLRGLDSADCRELARAKGLAALPHEVDAVAEATGGNPLALIETLLRGPRRAFGGLDVEVGASARAAWHEVLDRLPEATRRALFVLAVAQPVDLIPLETALRALGLSLHDLESAESRGLVIADGDGLRLRHALLGPVLTAATPTASRRAAYRALASSATPDREPWFRSLAATGPDDELAAELLRSARDESAHETVARFRRRAADLTTTAPLRAERLLSAARSALRAGRGERAATWCGEAAALRSDAGFLAAAATTRGQALALAGRHRQAYDELGDTAARLSRQDPVAAARLLSEATVPAMMLGEARLAFEAAAEAELLADGAPLSARACLQSAAARVLHGLPDKAAWPDGETALPSVDELAGDPASLVQAAAVHLWAERWGPARVAANAAIDGLRRDCSPSLLAVALAVRSDLGHRTGDWAAARADAVASIGQAEHATPNGTIAFGLLALARLDAVEGHGELCAHRLARGRREAGPYGVELRLLLEPAVRGLAALGAGEPGAVVEPLEAAWTHAVSRGVENPNVVPFAADLAEAHLRCGNRERAREVLSWLEERASALRLRVPLAGVWRCRGLLAGDVDEAAAAFAAAHELHSGLPTPFESARTLLCEGEVLRRHRRPAAARSSLRRAVHFFEGLGAAPWAVHAAAELAATGDRDTVRPAVTANEVLTPQQLRIAQLVAAGHNNVETAEALFLSRKTIEAHLTQVYRKLGVHSRTQLAKSLLAGVSGGSLEGPRSVEAVPECAGAVDGG